MNDDDLTGTTWIGPHGSTRVVIDRDPAPTPREVWRVQIVGYSVLIPYLAEDIHSWTRVPEAEPAELCPMRLGNLAGEKCGLPYGHGDHEWQRVAAIPWDLIERLRAVRAGGPWDWNNGLLVGIDAILDAADES